MYKIDLNCDMGEGFGHYKIGSDAEVIKYISSANIACGFHASDPVVMDRTVKISKEHDVSIGAHVGFHDIEGFGRRKIELSLEEIKLMVQYQLGALYAFCRSRGAEMHHVKPHGALYNMAAKDMGISLAICRGIFEFDENLILLGLSGSKMIEASRKVGIRSASEVFADRAYNYDGSLVQRGVQGAVLEEDEVVIKRALRMVKEGKVEDVHGNDISIQADSICIHGDGAKAVEFVKKIKRAFEAEKIQIKSL